MVSVGRILEGAFGLVRERFMAVAIWAGIYLVGNLVILFSMQPIIGAAANPATADPGAMVAAMAPIYLLNLILVLVGLVLYTAAMRAVLRPEAGGLAFLRVGMDELRMLLLLILFLFVGVVLSVGFMFVLTMVGAGVAMSSQSPLATGLIAFFASLALFALFLFLIIRFSLAFPLTLHRRQLVLGEAWVLSRGRFWTLFGAALVVTVIGIVMTIVLSSFALGSYFADIMAAAGDPAATARAAEAQMENVGQIGPMMILQSIGGAIVAGLWVALSGGSIASAAKLMLEPEFDDAEQVFG